MPTDHDTPEPAPDAAVGAPEPARSPDHANPTGGPSQPQDEAAMREWEGLPPETMILVPAFGAPPMRCPDDVWAMLVSAVDIIGDTDPDRAGEVALFAGCWVPDKPPANGSYDGDLVVRLTHPADPTYPLPRDHAADIEMLLAYHGRWQRVGRWCGVDDRWPRLVAPTAAAVMGLHDEVTEAAAVADTYAAAWSRTVAPPAAPPAVSRPVLRWARGGIADLLDAGLVTSGEEVVWSRRNLGVRHTARIQRDGTLLLADGRLFANPSGATTALGGNHQNGWTAWRRVSDGRTLGDLRADMRTRRGN
jgi:hypothetical protein